MDILKGERIDVTWRRKEEAESRMVQMQDLGVEIGAALKKWRGLASGVCPVEGVKDHDCCVTPSM